MMEASYRGARTRMDQTRICGLVPQMDLSSC